MRCRGTLNQMLVAQPGEAANVHFTWEGVHEDVRVVRVIMTWRVLVVAIRAASLEEQSALHQSPEYARRGFLEAF